MTGVRSLVWIGLAIAGLAAVWILLVDAPFSHDVRIDASDPWAIGNSEGAFAYAGQAITVLEGSARLRFNPLTADGLLEFELLPNEALLGLLGNEPSEESIVLRTRLERADGFWIDRTVHGDSGVGDSRLPEIPAQYAGSGEFELLVDNTRRAAGWHGFWCIGDALRRADGSIRDQGLVFSPLLRDQSGFSDPERLELTLLLYDAPESDVVLLHLVFSDVRLIEP